jgi:hypothetical protein
MERREFLKRLGFTGAAVAVTPQILAEIKPDPPAPISNGDITVITPDGRQIPCKSFSLDVLERTANGGIFDGDKCVFKIYDWSLEMERPFIDITPDPRYSPETVPFKEYAPGPSFSASVNGSGVIVEEFIPFNTDGPLRLILYDQDSVYDAEGYITALSYDVTFRESIEHALNFEISGEITRTFAG